MNHSLKIPEAEAILPDGTVELVQPPRTNLRPGRVFYEAARHKGHLQCPDCAVKLHYNPGSPTIGGNNLNGQRPHFRRAGGALHELFCALAKEDGAGEASVYDKDQGFKIHLNFPRFSTLYRGHSAVYRRAENNKLMMHPSLADMQPKSVRSVEDIVRLIRNADPKRLARSKVVYQDHILSWSKFFIRHARNQNEARFENLFEDLRAGYSYPVLMECKIGEQEFGDRAGPVVFAAPASLGEDRYLKRLNFAVPRIHLDNAHDEKVRGAIEKPGSYLVFGFPRLSTEQYGWVRHQILDMKVRDASQIAPVDLDQLWQRHKVRRMGAYAPV